MPTEIEYTRRLTRNYLVALGFIAALSIGIFFLLLGILRTNENTAAVINTAGRQRMLSQRVALYALRLVESPAGRQQHREELQRTVDRMATVHEQLHVSGGSFEGQNLPALSEEVSSIYFGPRGQLDAEIRSYISEAGALAAEPEALLTADNPHLQSLLVAADTRISDGLGEVVDQYQTESDATLTRLESLLIASVIVILLALALEGWFIFRPMVRRIREETGQLEEAYHQQRRIADTLQKNLISGEIPDIKGLKIALYYRSATRTAEVGGDFYDFINLPDGGWGIVLGDVAGKGIDAAVEPVKVRELMHDRAYPGLPPGALLESINDTLVRQYDEMFIAVSYIRYYPDREVLQIANAGNPFPFLLAAGSFIDLSEPPLAAVEGQEYTSLDVAFGRGETILLFTDGLAQAKTAGGFFGLGLERHLAGKEAMEPGQLVKSLVEEATELSGGELLDDILVMAIRRKE